jgi:hypothetical protein
MRLRIYVFMYTCVCVQCASLGDDDGPELPCMDVDENKVLMCSCVHVCMCSCVQVVMCYVF